MDDRQLSLDEVNSLLNMPQECTPEKPLKQTGAFSDQLDDGQLQAALSHVCKTAALDWCDQLAPWLRSAVQLESQTLRSVSLTELLHRFEHPTYLQTISAQPLTSEFLVELHPRASFPLIDRLLGGGATPCPMVRRPLTEIECRLMARITGALAKAWEKAWAPAIQLDVALGDVETNPQRLMDRPSTEPWWLIEWRLVFPHCEAPVRWAIRQRDVAAAASQLIAAQDQHGMVVVAGRGTVAQARLQHLRVGDVVTVDTKTEDLADVLINGQLRFRGRLGAKEGYKGIKLIEEVPATIQTLRIRRAG